MRWHFGIYLEARNQQSITFRLALYFSFLLLLIHNNRLRTRQREALDSPRAWPYIFASWHVDSTTSCCGIQPWDFLMLWGWEHIGTLPLWRAGSPSSTQPPGMLGHPSSLKQRNPQKLRGVSGLSCYSVILPLMERPASGFARFISLLSVPCLRLPLFWIQTYLITRHMHRTPVMSAFTHHRRTDCFCRQSLALQMSAARKLFVACFFVFSSCECWDKWLYLSQKLIECDFGGQGATLMHLCLLVQNRVFYSPPLFPLPPHLSLLFSAFCDW